MACKIARVELGRHHHLDDSPSFVPLEPFIMIGTHVSSYILAIDNNKNPNINAGELE